MRFTLDYPVKPFVLNQKFGVNGAYYQQHGINVKGHNGVDLRAKHGQPVYATHDGIAYHEVDSSSGCGVVLIGNEYDYKGGKAYFKTIYWHLADYSKEPALKSPVLDWQQKNKGKPKSVKKGDIIGYADNTGLSTGDHLHWGLKAIKPGNPQDDGQDAADIGIGKWVTLDYGNGYLGSIDPLPYCTGKYASDPVVEAPLTPADQVAVIAAQTQAAGNSKLADQLWAIVGLIKSFWTGK